MECIHKEFYDIDKEFKNGDIAKARYCKTCNKFIKFVRTVETKDFIMPYGKHKGKKLIDLPKDYLEWLLTMSKRTIQERVKEVLDGRYL